jgi:hypothetical protein
MSEEIKDMTHIHLSDGTKYDAVLVVFQDYIESNGKWRLFWENPGTSCGVYEQSTVTGQPFFRTMRDAVAYGERRYGMKAVKRQLKGM